MTIEGAPTWKAIVDAADDHQAGLIVRGSRGRAGLGGRLAGSVAGAVAFRARQPVLIVGDRGGANDALRTETSPGPARR